jgi:M6 family metalloprotease-like protein
MKRLIHIFFALCLVNALYAVVATPEPIWRELPDGSWAEVFIRGDEFYHYLTTFEGDIIPGTEVSSYLKSDPLHPMQRTEQEMLLTSYMPNKGHIKVPVILVNFTDLAFTMEDPIANFTDFYNGMGGTNPNATGSVHDYFIASSDSALNLQFDVYGPFTVSKPMAYYGANSGSNHGKNTRQLVIEAASLAHQSGVDFTQYDNNNDGVIDNLSIIVAGYNEAEGGHENTIWPHYSTIYGSDSYSGKKVSGYLMISEYRGSGGKQQAGIGTYCHEFGHVLGLPDLYDTYNSSRYTVGEWDIMCSGSYNNLGCTPPSYSAFERFAMGWLTPIQLKEEGDYRIEPLLESNTAYLIANSEHNLSMLHPNPNEYFLIENRQAVGWDANQEALIGTGMLVSHITFNSNKWNNNTFNNSTILGYAIVGAYDSDPAKSTPLDLFPGTGRVTSWLPILNDGTELQDQRIQNIKEMNDFSIRFSYGPLSNDGISFSEDSISTLVTTFDKRPITYDEREIEIIIRNLPNDSLLIYSTNKYFEFSYDNGSTWYNSAYKLTPEDSLFTFKLLLRYIPYRQSCTEISGFITIESTQALKMQQLEVSGYSPRPIYITQPELLEPTNITTNTFTTNWVAQKDAEYYYATLYSLVDKKDTISQPFDDFDSIENINEAGWSANFIRTSTIVSESKKGVLFTNTDEQLISNELITPMSGCRVWISNNYVSEVGKSASGGLLIEGKNKEGQWQKIDSIRVINTTKNLIKTYTLPDTNNIVQIRFTYTHRQGEGGCAIDGFEMYTNKTIQYIYQGTEIKMFGTDTTTTFHNLSPNTTYYFALQAYENKGCQENFSQISKHQPIHTLAEQKIDNDLKIIYQESGEHIVQLSEPTSGVSELCIYSAQGVLVNKIAIPVQTTQVQLPILPIKGVYFLKLVENGKIKRFNASGKLVN